MSERSRNKKTTWEAKFTEKFSSIKSELEQVDTAGLSDQGHYSKVMEIARKGLRQLEKLDSNPEKQFKEAGIFLKSLVTSLGDIYKIKEEVLEENPMGILRALCGPTLEEPDGLVPAAQAKDFFSTAESLKD
jgi:hypothetical protein